MESVDETYLLLLLSDSNLPTGSFVASSGLESSVQHGISTSIINYVRDSLSTYAHSTLPFVSDTVRIMEIFRGLANSDDQSVFDKALEDILTLDEFYEAATLNHVAKRASTSQGVALLTLYSKGFSLPHTLDRQAANGVGRNRIDKLVEQFKLMIRRNVAQGHLPVCWGVLTGALGLTLERSQYLFLFLHTRSLLSAAVRLNTLGPYAAQQSLLHEVRPLVSCEAARCRELRTGVIQDLNLDSLWNEECDGPATTWPLGEIVATRHDLQHSRIFNS